ncbi:hypothetical protein COV16_02235 [Candidatus Woesearchaeota archaeon CG10_big_fil_rev_8_21_14_0_10_34_8]|nr:MAG: hypothetical protein COV16_02235 [Candidatus Woesearchaeota archaeon CG10_big_fil_rev_8_21_14_0_10_34_8]
MARAKKKKQAKKITKNSAIGQSIAQILKNQKQLLASQKELSSAVKKITEEEKVVESEVSKEEEGLALFEEKEMHEMKQLEVLEKQIEEEVRENPLRKITYRDFTKGMIGAFVGIVAHFSFLEGLQVAEYFTVFRATILYGLSLVIGIAFLYFAGFRSVKDNMILKIIPLRILVIYASAIFVVVVVLFLFGIITSASHFEEVYKTVSAISVLAMLGACTADLIGKER